MYITKKRFPRSVVGWKGFCNETRACVYTGFRCARVYKNKDNKANTRYRLRPYSSISWVYNSGYHICTEEKHTYLWGHITKPVVGWELIAYGNQGSSIENPQMTYVAKYMRVFDTVAEAKRFKKELDARLKKEGK